MGRFIHKLSDVDRENDNFIMREIVDICRKGKEFYARLSNKVDSYSLRNQFLEMSEILSDMAESLSLTSGNTASNDAAVDSRFHDIDRWYTFYIDVFMDFEDPLFLDQLKIIENKQLLGFKDSIKSIKRGNNASLLAFHIAKIQIKHDNISSIMKFFRKK